MGKHTDRGEWCTDCGGVGNRLVTEGVSSPWEGVLAACETCQGVGYLVPKPKQRVEHTEVPCIACCGTGWRNTLIPSNLPGVADPAFVESRVPCYVCKGLGFSLVYSTRREEAKKLAALEKAELQALREFHQFFYHRGEALFADHGEEAVTLYNAAAKAHRETQSIDYNIPPCLECGALTQKEAETLCICSGDKDDCQGSAIWPDEE